MAKSLKYAPHALAFATGFLSLSLEILWLRFSSFTYVGIPHVLGTILCFYLAGIALGANIGKRWCQNDHNLYFKCGLTLLASGAFDSVAPWLVTYVMATSKLAAIAMLLPILVLAALLKSIIFPIAHYLGSKGAVGNIGSSVSKVYFSNILGSTLGPLLTGFVLLQTFGLQRNFAFIAMGTAVVGLLCLAKAKGFSWLLRKPASAMLAAAIAATFYLPDLLLPNLIVASHNAPGTVKQTIENRFGIVHMASFPGQADHTFGGNAYDGKVSVAFSPDQNNIFRIYALNAMHPNSSHILTVGLSTGAWARVMLAYPQVEHIDAVEINPAYLEIIAQYSEVNPILKDPRMHIHIDDGRRWIRRNPDNKYDLVVMNTTWHWRSYSSLLLSANFVRLCKRSMQPDAIFAYNTTASIDAFETVAREFRYAYRLDNFVLGSDRELSLSREDLVKSLTMMSLNGQSALRLDDVAGMRHVDEVLQSFEPYPVYRQRIIAQLGREPEPITDQNLVGEYRHSDTSPIAKQYNNIVNILSSSF